MEHLLQVVLVDCLELLGRAFGQGPFQSVEV